MDSEDESDQNDENTSGSDSESRSGDEWLGDEKNNVTAVKGENQVENGKDKNRRNKREKGPPIICLMCKTVWSKNRKGGRLFMFGGSRPFMAKFEAKLKALMGKEDLTALQNKSATKFGRSYVCRECYLMVRQTYDNIRKIQRDVAKSIQQVKCFEGLTTAIPNNDDSDSEQDLEIDHQAHDPPKKKLPPVAERIAEKISSLKLVKINSKLPKLILVPLTAEEISREETIYEESESDTSDSFLDSKSDGNDSSQGDHKSETETEINPVDQHASDSGERSDSIAAMAEGFVSQPLNGNIEEEQAVRSQTENFYSSKEAAECSAISLNVDTSFASQHSVNESPAVDNSHINTDNNLSQNNHQEDSSELLENNGLNSLGSDCAPGNKPSPAELAEILANPLLMIKYPQPIKLAEVKNENVYICGESGCDWIFSSRFFWENHIRHYHRSGKPFQCPFEDCGRSFTGKSKLELHVRSHTDERPFICDKCGSGFRGNQELRAHRLTHTSEKPHQCPKCDKIFKLLSSLKRHLQYHDGEFPYHCTYPECGKGFKSKYDLKCHYRLHTGEKPYKCPEPGCGMAFRIPCQFTMHKRSHTGERPFKCNLDGCSAAYISSNALQAHMLSHTSERPFCCEFCGKTFKHKMLYRMHIKKHTGPQSLICPVDGCGEEHPDRSSMDQHMTNYHGIQDYKSQNRKVFACPEEGCGLKYSTDGGLRYHKLRVHKKGNASCEEEADSRKLICPYDKCEREYEDSSSLHDHLSKAHMSIPREKMCPLCGQAFPHMQQLELHIHSFHNESSVVNEQLKGIFVCNSERCGLRFHRLEELKHHVNWHLGNPPYRCEFEECGRTFLLETMYSNHVLEHQNLKPHTCSFDHCQEGFTTRLKVLKHSKIHYGLFRCPVDGCGKAMQTLTTARMHLLRHEKPFPCMLCGKRFASSPLWMKHKRSHTGEKVYECKVCSCQYPDSESLKSHKRIHKGEKRYMCEECGQRFGSQASRKNHMKSHSRDLPFICPEEGCGKAFRESGSLKAHQNVHSKPSHLCTQCGKVYKFSVSKHRCKVEPEEQIGLPQQQKIEYIQQQPAQQQGTLPQHHLPPQLALSQQPIPQSLPKSMPQPLPQPMQQSLSQSIPQSLSQSLPQVLSQPIPQSLSQSVPQSISQSIPQSLAQPIPQSLSQSIPQSLSQSIPQSLSQSIPQSLSQSVPQSLSQSIPQSLAQPIPQSLSQSIPQSLSQSIPQSLSQSIPQSLAQPTLQSLPQPIPQSLTQSISQSLSQSIAQSLPQSIPQSLPQPISQSMPQAIPQSLAQALPQHLPQQLAPQQYNMNNVMMMSEPPPQSYVMEVEEAARAMRQNFGPPETIVIQDPAHYNYIILYDRPVQQ